MDGLVVLTGVHRVPDLLAAAPQRRPHLIARDLNGLLDPHPTPSRTEDGWLVGEALVTILSGDSAAAEGAPDEQNAQPARVSVVRPGADPLNLVRAGCAAAWAYSDLHPNVTLDPAPLLAALYALEKSGPWER
jgi:hypothetical protein